MGKRKPNLFEAVSPLVFMAVVFGIGCIIFDLDSAPLLIIAAIYAGLVGKKLGYSWDEMEKAIASKIEKAMPAEMILLAVGLLIGSWIYSGTIPMVIYYGMRLISAKYIIVTGFFACAIVSLMTGTSWGSAGTAGVAVMSIAAGLGAPLPAVAGACVAGALFGDKLSPISDTTVLASLVSGVDVFRHIKHMLYTTVPTALVGVAVYFVAGMRSVGTVGLPENASLMLNTLDKVYHWNLILILPMLIVLIGSFTKKPTIPVMLLSSGAALVLGMLVQGFHPVDSVRVLMYGFQVDMAHIPGLTAETAPWEVTRLLHRGGLESMMEPVLVTICCYCFAGIVEETGCLQKVVGIMLSRVRTTGGLISATAASSFVLAGIGGNTYISILMTGELFKKSYEDRGLAPENMSRTLEDAGTMTIGLFPWTSSGIYYAGILGVPVLQFLPWAVMCYLGIFLAVFYGYTGIGIKKLIP